MSPLCSGNGGVISHPHQTHTHTPKNKRCWKVFCQKPCILHHSCQKVEGYLRKSEQESTKIPGKHQWKKKGGQAKPPRCVSLCPCAQELPGDQLHAAGTIVQLLDNDLVLPDYAAGAFCLDPFWVKQAYLADGCLPLLRENKFDAGRILQAARPTLLGMLPQDESVRESLAAYLEIREPYVLDKYPDAPMPATKIVSWWKWHCATQDGLRAA